MQDTGFEAANTMWQQYVEAYPQSSKLAGGYLHFLLDQKQLSV